MKNISWLLFAFLLVSCGASGSNKSNTKPNDTIVKDSNLMPSASMIQTIKSNDTIILIGKTPVWVLSPTGTIKAEILVLPGWNFKKEKINQESDFCKKALSAGYRLVLPEMMKSVYATNYFPETRSDYKQNLTLTWVTDTMIKSLQKDYGIFMGKNNYLHGISTGSRGAALVHLKTGGLFTKVVLLSGDYDQTKMTNDNLMKNTYGAYNLFKDRWATIDNPFNLSAQFWTAQLYIGHGMEDDVVPVQQSISFADKIEKDHPECKVLKSFPAAKHDFNFWGGETNAILNFYQN